MAKLFSLFNMYVLGVLVRHLEPYGPWLVFLTYTCFMDRKNTRHVLLPMFLNTEPAQFW